MPHNKRPPHFRTVFLASVLIGWLGNAAASTAGREVPETMIVTYQVKPGAETALSRVIAEHWRLAQHLNLVHSTPHILVQGGEEGRHYILEILTWRNGSIPDNAPDAITRLWKQMSHYVVPRDGRPGIDLAPVKLLTQQTRQ